MFSVRAAMLAALVAVATSTLASQAFAHCFVGARFFPATLATDDPCVADELALPTRDRLDKSSSTPSSLCQAGRSIR